LSRRAANKYWTLRSDGVDEFRAVVTVHTWLREQLTDALRQEPEAASAEDAGHSERYGPLARLANHYTWALTGHVSEGRLPREAVDEFTASAEEACQRLAALEDAGLAREQLEIHLTRAWEHVLTHWWRGWEATYTTQDLSAVA
jgi:hypothetical protein